MKKICIVGIMAALCGVTQTNAVTIPDPFSPTSIPDMNYQYGYEWGISTATLNGATSLSSASFSITTTVSDTTLSSLYIDLIGAAPVAPNGFGTAKSGNSENGSDFWASQTGYQIQLGAPTYGTSATPNDNGKLITINITGTALADLNYDLAHYSGFNIAFDPNCTYYSSATSMSFTYAPTGGGHQGNVPDQAATVVLLGMGLLGLAAFSRKFVPAKNQA